MPEIAVTIKWQKEVWKDIKVNTDEGLEAFQAVVFKLSQVPPDRQKLICKGKLLKDDGTIKGLKKKAKVFLTGTADEIPTGPSKKIVFVEDMPETQQKQMEGTTSAGLTNLGNTCYMNSTLQCLRHTPEFRVALNRFAGGQAPEQMFVASLGKLFRDLDDSTEAVTPMMFVQLLRRLFAQFDETDEHGRHRQQDADECLSAILAAAGRHLTNVERDPQLQDEGSNAVDYLFGGRLLATRSCDEAPSEASTTQVESFRKLKCYIDSSVSFLYQGLNKSMEEKMELNSATLGRKAVYTRRLAISSLPRLLVIQFMRFSWGNARKEGFSTKAAKALKILKRVEYPEKFDVSDLCTDDLKKSFSYARLRLKEEKDKELGLTVDKEEPKKKKKTKKQKAESAQEQPSITEASPVSTSGFYEITGVVTHQGRAADGGHYIGWSKDQAGNWWRYDDAKVTPVKAEDIKNLAGGGDWHTAYLVFYRRVDDLRERPASWWKWQQDTASPSPAPA